MSKHANGTKSAVRAVEAAKAISALPKIGDHITIRFEGRPREGIICYLPRGKRSGMVRLVGEETVVPVHELVSFRPWKPDRFARPENFRAGTETGSVIVGSEGKMQALEG
jgi:hypothetical protein